MHFKHKEEGTEVMGTFHDKEPKENIMNVQKAHQMLGTTGLCMCDVRHL